MLALGSPFECASKTLQRAKGFEENGLIPLLGARRANQPRLSIVPLDLITTTTITTTTTHSYNVVRSILIIVCT